MKRADVCVFLIGVSIGALTGLLFAPYSGRKMRAQITGAVTDGGAQVKEYGGTMRDTISLHKEGVIDAIKRGAQVYKRAVS